MALAESSCCFPALSRYFALRVACPPARGAVCVYLVVVCTERGSGVLVAASEVSRAIFLECTPLIQRTGLIPNGVHPPFLPFTALDVPVHPFLGRFRQIVHAPNMVEDGSSTLRL